MTAVQDKIREDRCSTRKYDADFHFYQIIIIIGDSVLVGGFILGDDVLDGYGVNAKYLE